MRRRSPVHEHDGGTVALFAMALLSRMSGQDGATVRRVRGRRARHVTDGLKAITYVLVADGPLARKREGLP